MSIYHFTQNICFFFPYVNQVFHTHKMWIMWITLCITLIYGYFLITGYVDRVCMTLSTFPYLSTFFVQFVESYNFRSLQLFHERTYSCRLLIIVIGNLDSCSSIAGMDNLSISKYKVPHDQYIRFRRIPDLPAQAG